MVQQAACVVPSTPLAPLGLVLDVCYSEMTMVGPYATLGVNHRRSFRRNVVVPGTSDICREALESRHTCSSIGGGHTDGHFYCSGGYPGTPPPLVLLPHNHCNSGGAGTVGPHADSDPCIWAARVGVFGRFGVGVVGSTRFLLRAFGEACYIHTTPPCGLSCGISGSRPACYS